VSELAGSNVVLVMRVGRAGRFDHVECMSRLGLRLHLITEDPAAPADPRFASVTVIAKAKTTDELTDLTASMIESTGSRCAVTFMELDIVAVGQANARAGVASARPAADAIARDKSRQRRHLAAHAIASPRCIEVSTEEQALASLHEIDGPWICKPTRAADSSHVELAQDHASVAAALRSIRELVGYRGQNYYEGREEVWALIEEFLPGDEVTCDGVVVGGRFYLGGIHSKQVGQGPWFEEDLYTLPLADDAAEQEIVELVQRLVASLDLVHSLFNVELRRTQAGDFRVVEFSTRISGGHVYRNILDAHAIDLVDIYLRAALGDPEQAARQAEHRHPGRMATCIRFVYRTGIVAENCAGPAANDPAFRAYYPTANPGERVAAAPAGFDISGLLSVRVPLHAGPHPGYVQETARSLERQLALRVEDIHDAPGHRSGPGSS
jgi:biotin carboxylase